MMTLIINKLQLLLSFCSVYIFYCDHSGDTELFFMQIRYHYEIFEFIIKTLFSYQSLDFTRTPLLSLRVLSDTSLLLLKLCIKLRETRCYTTSIKSSKIFL